MYRYLLLATLLISLAHRNASAADPATVTEGDIRAAITRSLPLIEKEGLAWREQRKCSSCHEVTFMTWTFNLAQAKGFEIDVKKLEGWNDWCANESLEPRGFNIHNNSYNALKRRSLPEDILAKLQPLAGKHFATEKELLAVFTPEESTKHGVEIIKQVKDANGGAGNEHMQQMLLGRPAQPAGKMIEFIATTPAFLATMQQPNGFWKMGGQMPGLQWDKAEGEFVTTAWTVLALASVDNRGDAADAAIKKALEAFKTVKPGKTTEALLLTLLIEQRFGTAERAVELLAELRKGQNADGGWSWLRGGQSDVFTTGQVLYGLARYGKTSTDDAVARAQHYLVSTQGKDGFWTQDPRRMAGSKDEGRLKKLEPIHRYWASAWATIGLLEILPDKNTADAGTPAEDPELPELLARAQQTGEK